MTVGATLSVEIWRGTAIGQFRTSAYLAAVFAVGLVFVLNAG